MIPQHAAPGNISTRLTGWFDMREAAATYGCSTRTVARMIQDGRLPAYTLGTNRIRIRAEDLAALVVRVEPSEAGRPVNSGVAGHLAGGAGDATGGASRELLGATLADQDVSDNTELFGRNDDGGTR